MKSLIAKALLSILLMEYSINMYSIGVPAATESNPSQYIAIGVGQGAINGARTKQTEHMVETAGLQTLMGIELTMIKTWEKKYNEYLESTEGYAKALTVGTALLTEGVKAIRNVIELQSAITKNPQGIASGLSMNQYYIDLVNHLADSYSNLKDHIDKGGPINMMTGDERVALLWETGERLRDFNKQVRRVTATIRGFEFIDLWNDLTSGMGYKDKRQIALQALKRWQSRAEQAFDI